MAEWINQTAAVWWSWMAAVSVQAAVLILLVGAADMVLRRWAWPQLRYALYLLVLAKLVLGPAFTSPASVTWRLGPWTDWTVQSVTGSLEQTTATESATEAPTVTALPMGLTDEGPVQTQADEPAGVTQAGGYVAAAEWETAAAPLTEDSPGAGSTHGTVAVSSPDEATRAALGWQGYLFLVWLLGVVVLSGWVALRWRGLGRYGRQEGQDGLPAWFGQVLAEAAARLKLRRLPAVAVSAQVRAPAVYGLWRPRLLVPAEGLDGLTPREAEHFLLHELAHIKRGDLWVHGATLAVQIVYWFNPLLWLVRRQLTHLRELCCDATVARLLREQTADYRATLLETARRLLDRPTEPGLGLLGLFESSHRLVTRLRWLEKQTWRHRRLRLAVITAVVVGMLACVLPMAGADKEEAGTTADKPAVEASASEVPAGMVGTWYSDQLFGEKGKGEQWAIFPDGKIVIVDSSGGEKQVEYADGMIRYDGQEGRLSLTDDGFLLVYVTDPEQFVALRLHRIHEQPITTWLGGEAASPAGDSKEPKEASASDSTTFAAALPNGVTVELIGVTYIPVEEGRWWRPDGSVLGEGPFDRVDDDPGDDPEHHQYDYYAVAARLTGVPTAELGLIKWEFTGAKHASSTNAYRGSTLLYSEGMLAAAAKFPKDVQISTLRLGIAAGDWQTIAAGSHWGVYRHGEDSIIVDEPSVGGGPGSVRPDEVGLHIGVTHNIADRDFRVVAVGKDGTVHQSSRTGSWGAQNLRLTTGSFPNLSEGLPEFRFQVRPYEWVEFKDISLRAGQTSHVQVVTSESGDGVGAAGPKEKQYATALAPGGCFYFNGKKISGMEELAQAFKEVDNPENTIIQLVVTPDGLADEEWPAYGGLIHAIAKQYHFAGVEYVGAAREEAGLSSATGPSNLSRASIETLLASLEKRLIALRLELANRRSRLGPEHAEVKALEAAIESVEGVKTALQKQGGNVVTVNPEAAGPVQDANAMSVIVSGKVKRPGVYQATPEFSLARLIAGAGVAVDPNQSAYVDVHRRDDEEERQKLIASVELAALMAGKASDPLLQGGDIVTVRQGSSSLAPAFGEPSPASVGKRSREFLFNRKEILEKMVQDLERKRQSGQADVQELNQAKLDLLVVEGKLAQTAQELDAVLGRMRSLGQVMVKNAETLHKAGQIDSRELHQTRMDVLRAQIELTPSPQERVNLLQQIIMLYQYMVARTAALVQSGKASVDDLNKVKLLLLNAEHDLAEAEARVAKQADSVRAPNESSTPSTDFTFALPNGVKVTYLGFSDIDEDVLRWWAPMGRQIEIAGVNLADVDGLGTVLAFTIEVTKPHRDFYLTARIPYNPAKEKSLNKTWQVRDNLWLVPLEEYRRFVNLSMWTARTTLWKKSELIPVSYVDIENKLDMAQFNGVRIEPDKTMGPANPDNFLRVWIYTSGTNHIFKQVWAKSKTGELIEGKSLEGNRRIEFALLPRDLEGFVFEYSVSDRAEVLLKNISLIPGAALTGQVEQPVVVKDDSFHSSPEHPQVVVMFQRRP